MQPYAEMSTEELQELRKQLSAQYKEFQGKDLRLDMSRGKPSVEQLDLSMGMMDVLSSSDDLTCEDGTDCRNYGGLTGIREAKELIGDMMEVAPDYIIIYGNSSLNVMFDTVSSLERIAWEDSLLSSQRRVSWITFFPSSISSI